MIDRFECSFDGEVVFELDGDFVVDEGFEEAFIIGNQLVKNRIILHRKGERGRERCV